jgi:hypothetical protein
MQVRSAPIILGLVHVGVLMLAALANGPALAKPGDVTPADKAALPAYCKYTQGENGPVEGYKYHMQLVGTGFHAMHHYCWGLLSLMRVDRITAYPPHVRQFYLRDAVAEFEFVIRNWRAGNPNLLIPEILVRQAGAMVRLGRVADAIQRYHEAAELRPTYWPAFVGLAEAYVGAGNKVKARDILAQGLSHSPDVRSMLAMYEKLGGDRAALAAAPKPAASERPKPAGSDAPKHDADAPRSAPPGEVTGSDAAAGSQAVPAPAAAQ